MKRAFEHRRVALTCMVALAVVAAVASAQNAPATKTPAAAIPATPMSASTAAPQKLSAAQEAQMEADRDWLVAYLVSHDGYNLHQVEELEAKLNKMSPNRLQALVVMFKQRHDRMLAREQAEMSMRQMSVARDQSMLAQQQSMLNRVNTDENSAAQHFQQQYDANRARVMGAYYNDRPQYQPFNVAPYGYGPGGYGYGGW
jgi:hypothetical protein